MELEEYVRRWTAEQWDDAERVALEAAAMLGEDGNVGDLTVLVIEERKIDPTTTVKEVASLAILLGVETLLSIRLAAQNRTGCVVSPDVKARRKKSEKRRVRGV